MKSSFSKLFAAAAVWLALAVCSQASIIYIFAHGHGVQNDTVLTEYDESRDFDYARGYSVPMVGWYSTTFSYGYLLTVYVDTDYAINNYYNCCFQTNGTPIDIYIT